MAKVPKARGILLGLSACLHCEALVVRHPNEEAEPWGEPDDYTYKIYSVATGNADSIRKVHNDLTYKGAAWVAGVWGDCEREDVCKSGDIQVRDVKCKDVYTRNELADFECFGLPKPATAKRCDCEEAVCKTGVSHDCALNMTEPDYTQYSYEDVGPCYAWTWTDQQEKPHVGLEDFPLRCQAWPHFDAPCHAGLPYRAFRQPDNSTMDPGTCAAHCVGLGMDVFGIQYGKICRCGPSAVNQEVWRDFPVRNEQMFRPNHMKLYTRNTTEWCPLKVYRFIGAYTNLGVPEQLRTADIETLAYEERIEENDIILASDEEDGHPLEYGDTSVYDPSLKPWERHCFPLSCMPGAPWNQPGSRVSSINFRQPHSLWHEYSVIKYAVDYPKLDPDKTALLRHAMDLIEQETCIVFKEEKADQLSNEKHLLVTMGETEADTRRCYVKGLGMPLETGRDAYFSMGSCQNDLHVGNVLHVLLHVLGFSGTQTRPDALFNFSGQGPHMWNVDWWIIDAENRNNPMPEMFAVNSRSYMGSVRTGYVPFDYRSVMMASDLHHFEFQVPAPEKDHVGQRQHLSEGDVAMIRDAYSCAAKGATLQELRRKSRPQTLDAATEQEILLSRERHMADNIRDLEKADKYQPEAAKRARAMLEEISK